jgi:hypothetical protein
VAGSLVLRTTNNPVSIAGPYRSTKWRAPDRGDDAVKRISPLAIMAGAGLLTRRRRIIQR